MTGILVGVDGSSHSHRALEWAMNEAAIRHAPLTVITVFQTAVASHWGAIHYPEDHAQAEQTRQAIDEAVEKAQTELGHTNPASVTIQMVNGIPAEEIIKAAWDADMVVIGSRGAGGFSRLLLGSVGTQVAHHAPCPVVVIPTEDRS